MVTGRWRSPGSPADFTSQSAVLSSVWAARTAHSGSCFWASPRDIEPAAAALGTRRRHRPRMAHVFLKDHMFKSPFAVGSQPSFGRLGFSGFSGFGGEEAETESTCHRPQRDGLAGTPRIYCASVRRQGRSYSDPRFHGDGTVDMGPRWQIACPDRGAANASKFGACRRERTSQRSQFCCCNVSPTLLWVEKRGGQPPECCRRGEVTGRGPQTGSSCESCRWRSRPAPSGPQDGADR